MTQSQWDAIGQMILQMTSAEKQELIARVVTSLNAPVADEELDSQQRALEELLDRVKSSPPPEPTEEELEAQRKALDELSDEMAKLPVMSPDDGFTSADHDKILYSRPA